MYKNYQKQKTVAGYWDAVNLVIYNVNIQS